MERRIQEHCNGYIKNYKEFIRATIINEGLSENEKLEKIFHYECLNIDLAQFTKKKRVRNVIATEERCCAYRADEDVQEEKDGHDVWTHRKTHGMINSENNSYY